jgi:hypothetical protein
VLPQHREQPRREHDEAVLVPLGLLDAQDHPLAVDVADLEPDHLRDPKARRVDARQQRPVLEILDDSQQLRHLLAAEHHGELPGLLGVGDGLDRPLLPQGDPVEKA